MYIPVTYFRKPISEIESPNKYRSTTVLYKRGNIQSESFGSQILKILKIYSYIYYGFN